MSAGENEDVGLALAWLADAPLFIDGKQIEGFYDAVLRPAYREGQVSLSLETLHGKTTKLSLEGEAELGLPSWLTSILPGLKAGVKTSAGGAAESEASATEGTTIELHPIETPQRQLVQLALHYAVNLPRRARFAASPAQGDWASRTFIDGLPRGLVFIDFPSKTKFIPIAVEVTGGRVEKVYEDLAEKFSEHSGNEVPPVPDHRKLTKEQQDAGWNEYWSWYRDNFSSFEANELLEKAVCTGGGRVRWIDYRVPVEDREQPLHLHVCGHELFDTGIFAYNVIQRGYRHGLRVVGTVRSGPSLNVLAIFDK